MKIPFNVYDFFGYLACGFLLLCAIEYATDGKWLLQADTLDGVQALFWTLITYLLGQVIASSASLIIERGWLKRMLGPAEATLLGDEEGFGTLVWKTLFPDYYRAYSADFVKAIEDKVNGKVAVKNRRELFLHCHAEVKTDKTTNERLDIFLTQYGFARNVVFSLFLSAVVLWLAPKAGYGLPEAHKATWALAAFVMGLILLTRYVSFYLHYTREVFDTYNT